MNAEELCGKGGDHGDVFVEGSRRYSASFRVRIG